MKKPEKKINYRGGVTKPVTKQATKKSGYFDFNSMYPNKTIEKKKRKPDSFSGGW